MSAGGIARADITGLVLAGGRGSRMSGLDKGLVPWRGRPLARHALERLRPQVGTVAVNANRHLDDYAGWGVPVWPDADGRFTGPLAGVLAGLRHCPTGWLATVPCDSPLFPADLVPRLATAASRAGTRVAMAATGSPGSTATQPVFLLVHVSLHDDLERTLAEGEHRVGRWALRHGAALAVYREASPFFNANTAAELASIASPGRDG